MAYPWRVRPDPHRVLVSEVMLQQTQAGRVVHAFERFVERFPSVTELARASRADVVRAWNGLRYNRRAVALSEAARALVRDHGGEVPSAPAALAALPGVGPYTAAAVASLGHGESVAVVDTNVRRVVSRARLGVEPGEASERDVRRASQAWLDRDDPGAWNQALMDLGREVCRPVPRCEACPLRRTCRSVRPASGPRRAARPGRAGRPPAPPFEGSTRQVRGAVVRVLRDGRIMTVSGVARATGHALDPVAAAIRGLAADGILDAGAAALAGRPGGRVRLARG